MTVIAKALEQVVVVGQRVLLGGEDRARDRRRPDRPPGGAAARGCTGMEVHVLDRVESGLKPELVRALGATYHSGSVLDLGFEPDVIVECTGVGSVIADSIQKIGAGGVLCLTGVGGGGLLRLRRGRRRGQGGPEEQRARRQREREQAPLVQGRRRPWPRPTAAWLGRLITRREKPEDFRTGPGRDSPTTSRSSSSSRRSELCDELIRVKEERPREDDGDAIAGRAGDDAAQERN